MPDNPAPPDAPAIRSEAWPRPFVCRWRNDGFDAAWLHLAGELDVGSAPVLEQTLADPQLQARLVVLDLRELAFMDSSGVHAIVDASIRARTAGRRLVLLRGAASVDRLFGLTGATEHVEIGDIDPSEPPVQILLHLARADLAS